jgi:hypothetical protein
MADLEPTFDSLGDTMISNLSETNLLEPITPSLIWPQLIQHPKFLGSKIKINAMTTIDSIETEVIYEAIVHEISQSDNNELT